MAKRNRLPPIIKSLQILSPDEREEFARIIDAVGKPSEKRALAVLIQQVDQGAKSGTTEYNKEAVYSAAFPHRDLEKSSRRMTKELSVIYSNLQSEFDLYLVRRSLQSSPVDRSYFLLKELLKREHFTKVVKGLEKSAGLMSSPEEHLLEKFLRNQLLTDTQFAMGNPADPEMLGKTLDSLIIFFVQEYYKLKCGEAVRGNPIGSWQGEAFEKEVEGLMERFGGQWPKTVQAYALAFKMFSQPESETSFFALTQILLEEPQEIVAGELWDLFSHAHTWCARQINHGNHAMREQARKMYGFQIRTGNIFQYGRIEDQHLKNIVRLFCHKQARTDELEQVELLVQQNHKMGQDLPELDENLNQYKHQPLVPYNYNLAIIAFYRGQYKHSLKLLQSTPFRSRGVIYGLDAWIYRLKNKYELGLKETGQNSFFWEGESITLPLESFRNYLIKHRNDLVPARWDRYEQFRIFLLRWMRIWESMDPEPLKRKQAHALWDQIHAEQHNPLLKWITEKLEAQLPKSV